MPTPQKFSCNIVCTHLPLEEAVRAKLARHGHGDGLGDVRPGPEDCYADHLHRFLSKLASGRGVEF